MKAWTVIAIARDGEFVCIDCCTKEERDVWTGRLELDDVSVVFASDELDEGQICGRCRFPLAD